MKAIRNRKRLMYSKRRYKHLLESLHASILESSTEIEFLTRMVLLLTRQNKEERKKAAFAVYDEMKKEHGWDKGVLHGLLWQEGKDGQI